MFCFVFVFVTFCFTSIICLPIQNRRIDWAFCICFECCFVLLRIPYSYCTSEQYVLQLQLLCTEIHLHGNDIMYFIIYFLYFQSASSTALPLSETRASKGETRPTRLQLLRVWERSGSDACSAAGSRARPIQSAPASAAATATHICREDSEQQQWLHSPESI